MDDTPFDAVNGGIVYSLQQNARNTITNVATSVDVSDDTVRNRVRRLEERGAIEGYGADVDYNRLGIQHHYSSSVPPASANAKS